MDTDVEPASGARRPDEIPAPAADVEFLGRYEGSGYRHPRYLVRRADGQVAQVPELLYAVARHVDGRRDLADLAAVAGTETGRELTGEEVGHLVDDRLSPAGLAALPDRAADDGAATEVPSGRPPRSDHLMMLRMRTALIPESISLRLGGPLRWLFHRPVVAVALAAFVAVDVAIVGGHGWDALLRSGRALTATPALSLLVLVAVALAGAFHEIGHVTACRYGGARPGPMGVGVYLVFPAFYSTVTDAYRLSRAGRLRTDLGGVYFNALLLAVVVGVYLATGWPWLLAFVAFWHLETAWQFLPSLRLDGYYVLADLVGVPDLFNRIRPVLRGALRRRNDDPLVADLKPWVRRVVTAWVAFVIPFLLYWIVLFAVLAPSLAPAAWRSFTEAGRTVVDATADGRPVPAAAAAVNMVLLALPWIAGTYLVALQLRRLGRWITRTVRPPAGAPITTARFVTTAACVGVLGAGVGAGGVALLSRPDAVVPGPAAAVVDGSPALPGGPPTLQGRVTDVPDPTSAVVDVGGTPVTVRVVGLDATAVPECARDGASAFARDTLAGRTVTLVPDPTLPAAAPDPSSWPAYLVLDTQQSYTDLALQAGWGGAGEGRYRPGFLAEQDEARRSGAGMWAPDCGR